MAGKLRKPEPTPPFGLEKRLTSITEFCFHCCKPKDSYVDAWCSACSAEWDNLYAITRNLSDALDRNVAYTPTYDELIAFHRISEMVTEGILYPYQLDATVNQYRAYEAELERWDALHASGIGRGMLESTQLIQEALANGAKPESIRAYWNRWYIDELKAKAEEKGQPFEVPSTKVLDARFRAAWSRHKNKSAY